jgi:hypothetical protein
MAVLRCTIVLSAPRSGSTALAQAAMTIPTTFSSLEPYHYWRSHRREALLAAPTVEQLVSCEAWRSEQGQRLLSTYACVRGHLFGCTQAGIRHPVCWRCRSGASLLVVLAALLVAA